MYRLVKGNPKCRVHVLVMTSGHRGVTDRYLKSFLRGLKVNTNFPRKEIKEGLRLLNKKRNTPLNPKDQHFLLGLKTKIRRCEVKDEAKILSFTPHYLNLSIYDEHTITRNDHEHLFRVLSKLHHTGQSRLVIYPGMYDMHQTHTLCSQLTREVIDEHYPKMYERWTYESPWTQLHARSDVIIPLSEKALAEKIKATKAHKSQIERTPYDNLVEGVAVRNAAVLSETIGSFNVKKDYHLGKYVEVFARQSDRIIYV